MLRDVLNEVNVVIFVLQYFQRNTKLCDVNRRLKSQIWSSVVTIVLVEGKNLLPMDIDGFSDPYAKFRYANSIVTYVEFLEVPYFFIFRHSHICSHMHVCVSLLFNEQDF